jgi:hypothetical protein
MVPPPLISPEHDSRKFSVRRHLALSSYLAPPIIDNGLLSRLPWLVQRVGRSVQLEQRVWELWSPNSAVTPFLPGLAASPPEHCLQVPREHRHFDGHLGRFDFTISPQQFSPSAPWRGFILRSCLDSTERPELWPLHQYWEQLVPPPSFDAGRISGKWLDAISC